MFSQKTNPEFQIYMTYLRLVEEKKQEKMNKADLIGQKLVKIQNSGLGFHERMW